jgi:alpha-tubulin suppressor-like RCC1 family protein
VPAEVVGGHAFTMVSGGSQHSCALDTAGAVYCWGLANGMLGNGTTDFSRTPLPVSGGHTFKWVAAGGSHSCAVRTDGAAFCWGSNSNSQIGDGVAGTSARLTPSAVTGGLSFASIVGGSTHTCALTAAGAAYCWGANNAGQLGDGSTTTRELPTAVSGGHTFTSLTLLHATTCGLTAAGQAWCWGLNSDGQVGDNSTTNRLVPTQVSGGLTFSDLSAGSNNTCGVVSATGAAYCWGINTEGQLGIGSTGADQLTPLAVGGGHTFRDLVAGAFFACGIASDNKVYCWGRNNFGQLGNATNQNSLVPGPISGSLVF